MNLPITNVVNISVSAAPVGAGQYNTSNLAIFTREDFETSFGTDGYKIYKEPTEVGTDFGTSSETYKMALAIFSQQPNILAGGGYLVVIPFADTADVSAVQHITFSATRAAGSFKLGYGSEAPVTIAWDDDAAQIQTKLQSIAGLGSVTVADDAEDGFNITFAGVSGPATLLAVTDNSLQTADPFNVNISVVTTVIGTTASTETLATALTRADSLVQFFGYMAAEITSQANMLAAAAVTQALNKIGFYVSRTAADVETGGMLDLLRSGGYSKSRGLFYGGANDSSALGMMAAYAGRALSTVFSGSNTTSTMHLKDLATIQPDPSMTQTLLTKCLNAGADTYISLQGVPKIFCSGKNTFFDRVYNLQWLVGALQIAGFNYLAQTSTKIWQTEEGINGLRSAYRTVLEQAVRNKYFAPGAWNSPITFGSQDDFFNNISQIGYYIYSAPLSEQLQVDREDRKAPLIQIAGKEAGAVHSSNVLVSVNA